MTKTRTIDVKGFDLGVILLNQRPAGTAVKFSAEDLPELLTVWNHSLRDRLLQCLFQQATQTLCEIPSNDVEKAVIRAEQAVIAARPELIPDDLQSPPASAIVVSADYCHSNSSMAVALTFAYGPNQTLVMDGARCLVLFGYLTNTIRIFEDEYQTTFRAGDLLN